MLLFHEPLPKGDALVVMSLIGLWHEQPVYAHHTVQVGSSAQIEEFCSLGLTGLTRSFRSSPSRRRTTTSSSGSSTTRN